MVAVGAWLRIRSLHEDVAEVQPVTKNVQGAGTPPGVPTQAGQHRSATASGEISTARSDTTTPAERERRYRELLNSPPPPPPRSLEPPSTFDRVIGPLSKSPGTERSRSVAAPVAPASAAPPSTTRSPAPPGQQPIAKTTLSTSPVTETATEQDRDTDIQPPRLISAEFIPRQVQDGEETVFTATISDNLSGVRSASGVIVSPSGSVRGFSAVAAGASLFVARVRIPRGAPDGVWSLRDLTLTDNAANSTRLRGRGTLPPTAIFHVVSSSPDESGPQLKSVWLARAAVRAGERNTLFVKAADDKTGVAAVHGHFVSPDKSARISFKCATAEGGTWHCPISAPPCVACGAWRLEQVRLHDKVGNRTTFRSEHPAVNKVVLQLAGEQCDSTGPTLTTLSVDPQVVSNARATTVQVRAIVEDEGACAVASVSGEAVPPGRLGGQRHRIIFTPLGDGVTYIGTLHLQEAAVRGEWAISRIQLFDRGNNMRTYSGNDPVIAGATFKVE